MSDNGSLLLRATMGTLRRTQLDGGIVSTTVWVENMTVGTSTAEGVAGTYASRRGCNSQCCLAVGGMQGMLDDNKDGIFDAEKRSQSKCVEEEDSFEGVRECSSIHVTYHDHHI